MFQHGAAGWLCFSVELPVFQRGAACVSAWSRLCFSVELAAASGRGYLLVDPVLRVGHNDERLPLDAVALQSVLAKCLGPLAEWPGRLRVAAESGYNFVHLTPLQSLGASGSAYCLRDQLALNEAFSRPGEEKTFADVAALIHTMKVRRLAARTATTRAGSNDSDNSISKYQGTTWHRCRIFLMYRNID